MRNFERVWLLGGVLAAAVTVYAGCGGYGGGGGGLYGGGGGGGGGAAAFAGINLFSASGESPTINPTYGMILGYFNGKTLNTTTQVITLAANTSVAFVNLDSVTHTASFLGNAMPTPATWPATFASANSNGTTASAAGTAINTVNFSTGNLSMGATSATYNSGPPGVYMIGCFYHYDTYGLRDIVVVS